MRGWFAVLWVVVGACGSPQDGPTDLPTLPQDVDAMPADPGAAVVLDPGVEPRASLRYRLDENASRSPGSPARWSRRGPRT
jgi:hypothetical protein